MIQSNYSPKVRGIFTNKQRWRRQNANARRGMHDFIYEQDQYFSCFFGITRRSYSELSFANNLRRHGRSTGKAWATTGDLLKSPSSTMLSIGTPRRRTVSFSPTVRVVLIPTVDEYKAALLGPHIWWCDDDYREFKRDALCEVKQYISTRPGIDLKVAIKEIYEGTQASLEEASDDDSSKISSSTEGRKFSSADILPFNHSRDDEEISDSTDSDINSPCSETKSNHGSHRSSSSEQKRSFKLLGDVKKPHSFSGSPSPVGINELPGLPRGKTDVDIVHEHQELCARLRSGDGGGHVDHQISYSEGANNCVPSGLFDIHAKLSTSNRRARQEPIHPLALICS